MSATNRGAERAPQDFYETPDWLTRAILPHLPPFRTVLEPACGKHAIVRELERAWPTARIVCCDLNGCASGGAEDFLKIAPCEGIDLIVTNPPYSLAEEFVRHALRFRGAVVVMLLRVNFLGSKKRAAWLREHTPSIYVSPRRPSFTGNGTDATEYAWFVWDGKRRVEILRME